MKMIFSNGYDRCPAFTDLQNIYKDIQTIHSSLESRVKTESRRRRTRDSLAYQLEELQDVVQEALISRENTTPDPDDLSLLEKIEHFLNWRNELQVLHSSIGRSLGIAKRMRGSHREEIDDLQEIHDEITEYLYDTDYLHEKAQEKLQQMRRAPEPRANQNSGPDSGYQSPRASAPARFHSNRYLTSIVNDAEKIKADSVETSLRMENEVERLKARSIEMAKDLVALNKVIERQKRELVELTRMKRSNEIAEKELEDFQ